MMICVSSLVEFMQSGRAVVDSDLDLGSKNYAKKALIRNYSDHECHSAGFI